MIRFSERELHPKAVEILRRGLTFANAEYVNRTRFGRWVGSTPEEIVLIQVGNDETLSIPRGAITVLRDAISRVGSQISIIDKRVVRRPIDYRPVDGLRDYQRNAANALVKRVQGCVIMPCGSGKSLVAIAAIAKTKQPAIVLVHTKDLLGQWQDLIYRVLGLKAGIIADGKLQTDIVTIAMVQTLATMDSADLTAIGNRFGIVVLDEAHHCPATVFRSTLSNFAGKYRFGLTATPERADGLSPLIDLCIGPVVFEIDHARLVASGHLVIPRVVSIKTGCSLEAASYSRMVASLIKSPQRNALIVDLARQEVEDGKIVLILSGRLEHCRVLARSLQSAGIKAEALTGNTGRAKRREIIERFRARELSVVCATTLADEGLDVATLERLILATPARAESRTIQRLGRLMRPYPGKDTPILYDLIDDSPMARRQHAARSRAYRKVLGNDAVESDAVSSKLHLLPQVIAN
ncbi:MAG: DEAD/DEAH box helicase [Deltaproteobacteria bacterium]|nr:DEAD/DEAH box helicase [Deltaproteobacteria bacterium]